MGRGGPGHCWSAIQKELIRSSLRHMAFLELEIREWDALIGGWIKSSRQQEPYRLLHTIPGIRQEAANILAETGPDMKPFPDAAHMSSWEASVRATTRVPAGTRTGIPPRGIPGIGRR
jgi:transposase